MTALPLLERAPDDAVARLNGRLVTAAEFLAQVEALKSRLPPARRIINLCEDRYHFMLGFAAAIAAGRTNLLPPNRLPATVECVRGDYPDSVVLDDALPAACLGADGGGTEVPQISADHLAAIVFTSGSTGQPQAIRKPWRTFVESTRLNARELAVSDTAVELVATVPAQHMYGLETSVLLPLFAPVTASGARPFFPGDITRALESMHVPRVLVSTPVHLHALAEAVPDLPTLARIWSATAPLDAGLARRLEAVYRTGVTEIYGCSETGCLARRAPVSDAGWQPFGGFDFTADGDVTVVSAPHLPAPVRLNDRLDMDADGRFRLLGRGCDLVNIAGKRGSLTELNNQLQSIAGVVDGVIFEPPAGDRPVQRLAALVVAPELNVADIRRALCREVDGAFLPRPIYKVGALPRAETGKLCRQDILRLYRDASRPSWKACPGHRPGAASTGPL